MEGPQASGPKDQHGLSWPGVAGQMAQNRPCLTLAHGSLEAKGRGSGGGHVWALELRSQPGQPLGRVYQPARPALGAVNPHLQRPLAAQRFWKITPWRQ